MARNGGSRHRCCSMRYGSLPSARTVVRLPGGVFLPAGFTEPWLGTSLCESERGKLCKPSPSSLVPFSPPEARTTRRAVCCRVALIGTRGQMAPPPVASVSRKRSRCRSALLSTNPCPFPVPKVPREVTHLVADDRITRDFGRRRPGPLTASCRAVGVSSAEFSQRFPIVDATLLCP
jgi:hypothetical protein